MSNTADANQNSQPLTLEEMPEMLNAEIIATYLEVSYNKALSLIKYGGMIYLRLGNVYRVPKKNFISWLYRDESIEIQLS